MSDVLTREQFLAAAQRRAVVVEVDGLGPVRLLSLRMQDRSALIPKEGESDEAAAIRAIVVSVVDEADQPLFTEADIPALGQLDSGVLGAVVRHVLDLNQMGTGAEEQLEKN